jgi:hypothetical protein
MRRQIFVHLFSALLLVSAAGLSGCGDAETGGSGSNNANNGESNNGETVDMTLAASIEVTLDPLRAVYQTGLTVTPEAVVRNGNDEVMSAAEVEWTVEPTSAASADAGSYELLGEGEVTFKACTVEAGIYGESVCGEKRILVDDRPPILEVTSPTPGEWLGDDGAQTITVAGTIDDTHGTQAVYVNGKGAQVSDDGTFTVSIAPEFGVNHIEVVASDAVNRAADKVLFDVLWAPSYYDMTNTATHTGFSFDDGLVLDLGQRFFDDGQTPVQPDESAYVTEDLVDILTLLVKNIDFMNQIPDPVLDTDSGQLRITDLTIGEPQVLLDLTDTGAELFIWVPDVDIQTQGGIALDDRVLDLTGSIDAEIAGYAVLDITKPAPGEDFVADVTDISMSIQNAESNFASPEANAVFELAESALRGTIEDILVGTLSDQFVDELPALLVDALNSIEDQLSGLSFDLDTEFTDPLTIILDGMIDVFETTYRNSMTAILSTDISANQPSALTHSPGIPLAVPYTNELALFESSRAQVGVRLALLNGLLHTLWETGFLEIDLTSVMPDDYAGVTEHAELSAKLQPILSRPKAGEPYDFMLRAGQMEIEAELLNQTDVYVVNLEVGILMSLADNAISLTVPDDPTIITWVASTTGERSILDEDAVRGLIMNEVWPQIEDTLKQGLSFELPVPGLSGISDLAPTLSELDVQFLLDRPVDFRNGFIIFDAILQGTLPLGQ